MIKLIVFVKRKPGLTREEFHSYWFNRHALLVKNVASRWRHVRRYVQNHAVDEPSLPFAGGDFDGCAEVWFDSIEDLHAAYADPNYLTVIRPDEELFADVGQSIALLTVEHEISGARSLSQ